MANSKLQGKVQELDRTSLLTKCFTAALTSEQLYIKINTIK